MPGGWAAELGVVLADAASVHSVGEQVSTAVRERVDAADVVINVLAPGGKRFKQLADEGAEAQIAAMATQWTTDSDAPGPRAVRNRAAVYLPDRETAGPDFADARQVSQVLGLKSSAALPLLTEVGALGYLGVWWKEPHETTAAERQYLHSIAGTASRALEPLPPLIDAAHLLAQLGQPHGGPVVGNVQPAHRFGEPRVRVHAGDHDPRVNGQHLDPDQRHPHVRVDHHPFVQDRLDHVGQARRGQPTAASALAHYCHARHPARSAARQFGPGRIPQRRRRPLPPWDRDPGPGPGAEALDLRPSQVSR